MKRKIDLGERNVVAPDAIEIADGMRSQIHIGEWWEMVKLYAEAMNGLGRAVMLEFDHDSRKWYFASIEREIVP